MPGLFQMRVGVPLSELRYELMAETRQSLNPAQTTSSTPFYNYALNRTQREQWNLILWPHLVLYEDLPMVAGQRYYDYPASLPFDSITEIWWPQGVNWVPLTYGITPDIYATMGGELVQQWPPRRWRNVPQYDPDTQMTDPASQFEVWPIPPPNQPFSLRLQGQAPLNVLSVDTDVCVLDATLLVLFAAAEILADQKNEGAALKLQKAQQYQRRLIANCGAIKRRMVSLSRDGGNMGPIYGQKRAVPYLDYIPMS